MEDRKVKQVLFGGWHQWEEGGHKERVKEGEYGRNIMYSCMKMKK
jgi:chitinase